MKEHFKVYPGSWDHPVSPDDLLESISFRLCNQYEYVCHFLINVRAKKTTSSKADIPIEILLTNGILQSPGSGFFRLNKKARIKNKIIAAI